MRVNIVSFGHRHGPPPGADLHWDIDARVLRNPYHNKALRGLRGTDPLVQEDILRTPDIDQWLQDQLFHVRDFLMVCHSTDEVTVRIGCTGGHHRSVFVAEWLYKRLVGMPHVTLEHRDIDKP